MSADAVVTDAIGASGAILHFRPTFRSRALATVAIIVATASVVALGVEIYYQITVLTVPAAWALSEFHTMLHAGLFGSFGNEHPNIAKVTQFVGLGALLALSGRHLRHDWVHHVRDSFVKDGAKVLLPAMKKEFGGNVALCLLKSSKIAMKAKAHKFALKLADIYYDSSRRHTGPSLNGVP
jgi:hypothetical protein